MTWRNFAGGGGGGELRVNETLIFFSGERDERAHHVLTVSCSFYFASVMSRSVPGVRRSTNLLALRKILQPHHRGLTTPTGCRKDFTASSPTASPHTSPYAIQIAKRLPTASQTTMRCFVLGCTVRSFLAVSMCCKSDPRRLCAPAYQIEDMGTRPCRAIVGLPARPCRAPIPFPNTGPNHV